MHKKFMVLLVCICMLLAALPMALAAVNLNPWEIDYNLGLSGTKERHSNTLLQASDGTVYSGSMSGVWGYTEGKWFDFSQGFPIGFPINDVDISVHALIEPVEGTLYAGTSKGVWKHSGGSWEDASNGLLDGLEVYALLHAADGTLYAGTESGVWKLDEGQWKAFSQGMPEDESFAKVYAMLDATDGFVYAGSSEGIWKLQAGTWISFNEGFDVDGDEVPEVLFLFQASDGTQYAGTNAGIWKRESNVWVHYSAGLALEGNIPWVAALIETTGGTIYAGTMEDVWLLKDETWVSMPTKIDGHLLEVYALLESTSGTLFAASEYGVWSYHADEELWTDISQPVEYADTLVYSFLQSSNGTLYAGTVGRVWENVGNGWAKSLTTHKDGVWPLSNSVDFLVEASDGVIYAVTLSGNAWKWDHGTWTQILDCEMEDFSEDSVSSVVVNGDTLYVGYYWHGVRAYHAGTWVDVSEGLPALKDGSDYLAVNSLVATPEGTMYALASEHIWVYAEGVWTSNPNHPEMEVLSLAMASDGTLYVAFFPEGIWAFTQGAWTNISAGLPSFNFEGLMVCYALPGLVSQDGTLYAQVVTSPDSSGLYAYRGGVWTNVSGGLPEDYPAQILGLCESFEGTIYAYSIRQGIWGFDGSVWQDVSEGLPYGSIAPYSVNDSEDDDRNYVSVQIMVEASDGTMYAGTYGEGIWKNRSLSLTSSYTISFNANGGSVTPSSAKTSGNGMLASLPTPTRSGYTFSGWFTASSGGTRISTSTVFSANGTIYAQWASSSSYIPPSNNSSSSSSSSSSASSPASGNTSGWSNLAMEVGKTEEGGSFTIDMKGNTNVPSSFLRNIAGKDVNVHFDMGNGLEWIINGKDIPTEGPLSSLNLGARLGGASLAALVQNIDGSSSYVHLTITHDGGFPFTLTLQVTLDKVNAGFIANLYYHNPETGKLEFVASAKVDEDGTVQLQFEHASSYAIIVSATSHNPNASVEDEKPEEETKPEEEETPPVEEDKPSEEENTPEVKPLPIVLTIDSTVVTRGVERLPSPPVAPKIINDRSMLPFRYLIQTLLGGTVEWVEETRTVHAVVNGITFQLAIDNDTIVVDGEAFQLDQAPVIVDDHTLVPLRAFEAAVESIHWLADARQVEVYTAE